MTDGPPHDDLTGIIFSGQGPHKKTKRPRNSVSTRPWSRLSSPDSARATNGAMASSEAAHESIIASPGASCWDAPALRGYVKQMYVRRPWRPPVRYCGQCTRLTVESQAYSPPRAPSDGRFVAHTAPLPSPRTMRINPQMQSPARSPASSVFQTSCRAWPRRSFGL